MQELLLVLGNKKINFKRKKYLNSICNTNNPLRPALLLQGYSDLFPVLHILSCVLCSYNLRCQEISSKGKAIEFELEICQLPDMDMVGKLIIFL